MKSLNILYICSELSPFASMGGLGDVARSLPRALRAEGHDVRIALPCYGTIPYHLRGEPVCMCVADLGAKTAYGQLRLSTVPDTDIPLFLVEHDAYFDRPNLYGDGAYEYTDNAERFCFFCLATLHGIAQTGWHPDIVHCHDWHTAPVAAHIKTRLANTDAWRGMPTLLTIHNLAHQGRYKAVHLPFTGLGRELFNPRCLEYYGDINLLKAGIAFASKINTVSPMYAEEIQTPQFGEGLDGFLRTRTNSLSGILNGIDYDQWSPSTDSLIAARYAVDDMAGKAVCKRHLQRRLGLPERRVPLFGMVSRIYWQKGVDLVAAALDRMMALDIQVAILGKGDPYYERILGEFCTRYPGKLRVMCQFDYPLSHHIEAGSDFFLMPSHYEPCGLSQLYSLAYGAVPIVRRTGGLADSVVPITPANLKKGKATGLVFGPATPEAFLEAVQEATSLFKRPDAYKAVRESGMKQDFSWSRSSKAYVRLYRMAMGGTVIDTAFPGDTITVETHSPDETERLGRLLGEVVPIGTLVALSGELAAGKTCLVRGMAARYARGENVSSPTFTLVNQYGRTPRLYHVDLYRLDDPRQLADLGYEDLMDPSDGVCVIEWAERAEGFLPARRLDIRLEHVDEEVRCIRIRDTGVMPAGWQTRLIAFKNPVTELETPTG